MSQEIKQKILSYIDDLIKKTDEKQEFLVHEKFLKEHQTGILSQICAIPQHVNYKEMVDACTVTAGDHNALIEELYNQTKEQLTQLRIQAETLSDDEIRMRGQEFVNQSHTLYTVYRDKNSEIQKQVTSMVNDLYHIRDQIYAQQLLEFIQKKF